MSIDTVTETMLRIAERFGVPVVLLAVLLFFGREAVVGLHRTVVAPVVESHTQFVDAIVEQTRAQTGAMEQQAKAFCDLSESHEEQLAILRRAFPEATAAGERRREPVGLP